MPAHSLSLPLHPTDDLADRLQAWLRSRGGAAAAAGRVFDAEAVAEQFGVAAQSYDPVMLPRGAEVLQVGRWGGHGCMAGLGSGGVCWVCGARRVLTLSP